MTKHTLTYDETGLLTSGYMEYKDGSYRTIARMQAIKSQAELDAVIKEVDTYVTEDGTRAKTSTSNETMAQDGDHYYVGDRSGIGPKPIVQNLPYRKRSV